jgi:hypothetical protein
MMKDETRAGIFPLPGVGPPCVPTSRSRRIMGRYNYRSRVTAVANLSVSALNQLNTSFAGPSPLLPPPASGLPAAQSRITKRVVDAADRYVSRLSSSGSTSGDSCGDLDLTLGVQWKQSLAIQAMDALPRNYVTTDGPVPLIADRVSLPSVAGAVDLLDCLPPHLAKIYSSPEKCLRAAGSGISSPSTTGGKLPKPRAFASPSEYHALIKRMVDIKMVEFTENPIVVNGLFGVPKPDGNIRLVIDGRPANDVFVEPPHIALPTPDLLSKLEVPEGKKLYVAKTDLSDYYYRISIPAWMRKYFALPGVRAGDIDMGGTYGDDTTIYPCLTVLAMGWSHSVFCAQSIHEHIINSFTSLKPADRITPTSDLKVDRLRYCVYIDDVCWFSTVEDEVKRSQDEYISVMDVRHLPVKPSKVTRPSCNGVECLGMDVNGCDHTVGVRVEKLVALCKATQQLLQVGGATGIQLSRIVGKWTWAMLVFRPLLSIFNSVYRFIKSAQNKVYCLWRSVTMELDMAIRLAPLMYSSLSSPWFDRAIACDASLSGFGVVAATVSSEAIDYAVANSHPFFWVDNDRQAKANAPLVEAKWMTKIARPWRDTGKEHINQLELRAISASIRWMLSHPNSIRRRLFLVSDSQVCVGSLQKGRSSAHYLLRRIRPISACLIASGTQLNIYWIKSNLNPADKPSRIHEPPKVK